MKIKELSIGDWVRHTFYEENVQIVRIYGDGERVLAERGKLSISCHLNHFEPIPLTPEILEKNGFVKDLKNGEAYKIKLAFSQHLLLFKVGDGCCWMFRLVLSLFEDFDIAKVEIKYVHQLQHALRLAGIDKEIEL